MTARGETTVKCKKCGKNVKDKTIIKHMWADHRAHMMKNHVGAKKKKTAPLKDDRWEQQRDALMDIVGPLPRHVAGAGLPRPPAHRLRAVRFAIEAGQTVASSGEIGQKKLTVVIHQDGNSIEIANVTRVDFME